MNKNPHTDVPLTAEGRKVLGQGIFVFGLGMLVMGLHLGIAGFDWPLGGKERGIDTLIMAVFGPEYAPLAMVSFFVGLGVFFGYKGIKMWRGNA
ncbi:hypothetical protein [Paucimonas lemoignei]|uniref:hypothetical protein n=1 Tax=Paucimonas lemoignei TaxID=29443 RepID=UPI001046D538|nr:hypothetical protein [Paucimonas lemoignei]